MTQKVNQPKSKNGWSKKKEAVAKAMAEGIESQRSIAERFDMAEETISRWKQDPEFLKKVDDLTLSLEKHTVAGMLRRISEQQAKTTVREDEWLKLEEFRAKLLGHDKQKIEHGDQRIIIDIRRNDSDKKIDLDSDRPAITDT